MLEWLNYYYIMALILVVPAKLVCDKAGFNPRMSFLLLVPFVGYLGLCFILAFKPWPISKLQDGRRA